MGAEVEFKPGMFHLFNPNDEEAAKAMLDRAEDYLKEYDGFPSMALKNAAGVAQCVLGKKEKALELFGQVLKNDPKNINALENSRIVHSQLGQKEDAEDCAVKVQSLLDYSQSEWDLALRKARARCFAEQGLAVTTNVAADMLETTGGKDLERIMKALSLSEKAFQLDDGKIFATKERLEWQYFLGKSYFKVHNHYLRMKARSEEQLDIYNKAVHALARVLQEPNQITNQYKAKAWTLLGTLFWKKIPSVDKPSSLTECNLTREYDEPDLCFTRARDLSPTDPKIRSRYSRFLMNNKEYAKARHNLDKSIEIDQSRRNWLAYSSRAQVYIRMYREKFWSDKTHDEHDEQDFESFQTDESSEKFSSKRRAKRCKNIVGAGSGS